MKTSIVTMQEPHVPQAVELFRAAYRRERASSPLLPPEPMGDGEAVASRIRADLAKPCVAAFEGERLLGYLCVSARFPFKGQQAAVVREHGHAAVPEMRRRLHQDLYAALGELLVRGGTHLHIIAHLSADQELKQALFELGFGAFLAERLRDLSSVTDAPAVRVEREREAAAILPLEMEHRRYYRQSPIFLIKDESEGAALSGLREALSSGSALFVCRVQGDSCAYMMVGRCTGEESGHLLAGSNTAQIYSAYAKPFARGRGVGTALLQRCIEWARQERFDRLLVEHETANPLGSRFWERYFTPYLYFSMRYVDNGL